MNEMIFWGILASLAFAELTGISPGGIIVPAYFLMYFHDPVRMALTLGLSLLCLGFVRLLSRYTILYGRRRFVIFLLSGMLLKAIFAFAYANSPVAIPNLSLSIGYVIPGLLARDAEKQGIVRTFLGLAIVVCFLRLGQLLFAG